MRTIGKIIRGGLAVTGLAAIISGVASLAYLFGRLRTITSGYKFGPARRASYLSRIVHNANRAVDDAAIAEWKNANDEDVEHYARIEEEHDRLLDEAKRNGTWDVNAKRDRG